MPRRSLFCVSAPMELVHWYQPRLGGAHLRPHVRTRHSTERGQSSGKKRAVGDVWGHGSRKMKIRPLRHGIEAGMFVPHSKAFVQVAAFSAGVGQGSGGARASKTRRRGVNQRTVDFLSGQTRCFGFRVCYLGLGTSTTTQVPTSRARIACGREAGKTEPNVGGDVCAPSCTAEPALVSRRQSYPLITPMRRFPQLRLIVFL